MSLAKALKAKKIKRHFEDGGGDGIGGEGTGYGEPATAAPSTSDVATESFATNDMSPSDAASLAASLGFDTGMEGVPGVPAGPTSGNPSYGVPDGGLGTPGLGLSPSMAAGLASAAFGPAIGAAVGMAVSGMSGFGQQTGSFSGGVSGGSAGNGASSYGSDGNGGSASPFGGATPAQTTPVAPAAATGTGQRQYVWDQATHTYVLQDLGAQDNPMGYSQGQVFHAAKGGPVPSGIAAGLSPRLIDGPGTGLSDSIPVQMDDGKEGRLGRGEFVISADVVSGLGGGSTEAGAAELYKMMERIRKQAHGSKQQVRPVNPQSVLPA